MAEQEPEIPPDASSLMGEISDRLMLPEAMNYTPAEIAVRDRVQAALHASTAASGFSDIRSFIEEDPEGAVDEVLWGAFTGDREVAGNYKGLLYETFLAEMGGTVIKRVVKKKPEDT